MKQFFLFLVLAFFITTFSSCAAGRNMKRDCQGRKHVRLQNGIYI